jgi:hypothetical protein
MQALTSDVETLVGGNSRLHTGVHQPPRRRKKEEFFTGVKWMHIEETASAIASGVKMSEISPSSSIEIYHYCTQPLTRANHQGT